VLLVSEYGVDRDWLASQPGIYVKAGAMKLVRIRSCPHRGYGARDLIAGNLVSVRWFEGDCWVDETHREYGLNSYVRRSSYRIECYGKLRSGALGRPR